MINRNMKRAMMAIFMLCMTQLSMAQQAVDKPRTPIMGWASWNNFRVNINEQIIREQADAMVKKGLQDAGYQYINVDDGFFGGRNEKGELLHNRQRFPGGMKKLSDYIHSKGLKAGIYAEAGINTCASIWDRDSIGSGSGLYGHDEQDLTTLLKNWGYDFLKVDWCGGKDLGLDEQLRYTQIADWIRRIKPEVVYNICRWQFPGKWAPLIADSWRISGDINNDFASILRIIALNTDLWQYSSPGHFNDMDMLQVGRGMSFEEDKSHFSMWCILNSPLLLGNDLRKISGQTLSIITNKEVIALNQDPLCYQARKFSDSLGVQLWAKPLISVRSGEVGVALLNTTNAPATAELNIGAIGLNADKSVTVRDLWLHKESKLAAGKKLMYQLPAHGVVVLKVSGTSVPFNVFTKN
ncbi:glycoside hydrolase family 27 protein [Chitinophaga sp. Hz27]|uniref:glycoside hydrolase family 27 protein n=1 Tax=Chitinophaga sp. Hz27 TaxID=3347169 RepID=UPI0035DD834C